MNINHLKNDKLRSDGEKSIETRELRFQFWGFLLPVMLYPCSDVFLVADFNQKVRVMVSILGVFGTVRFFFCYV